MSEFRSYTTSHVKRRLLNKFSKLSPLPERNPVLTAMTIPGLCQLRHRCIPRTSRFLSCPSFLVVARDARGNLLLRTAGSARKERSLRGDVKYARDSTIIKGQKYFPLVLFSVRRLVRGFMAFPFLYFFSERRPPFPRHRALAVEPDKTITFADAFGATSSASFCVALRRNRRVCCEQGGGRAVSRE